MILKGEKCHITAFTCYTKDYCHRFQWYMIQNDMNIKPAPSVYKTIINKLRVETTEKNIIYITPLKIYSVIQQVCCFSVAFGASMITIRLIGVSFYWTPNKLVSAELFPICVHIVMVAVLCTGPKHFSVGTAWWLRRLRCRQRPRFESDPRCWTTFRLSCHCFI